MEEQGLPAPEEGRIDQSDWTQLRPPDDSPRALLRRRQFHGDPTSAIRHQEDDRQAFCQDIRNLRSRRFRPAIPRVRSE